VRSCDRRDDLNRGGADEILESIEAEAAQGSGGSP
jgi:hypothetical protein